MKLKFYLRTCFDWLDYQWNNKAKICLHMIKFRFRSVWNSFLAQNNRNLLQRKNGCLRIKWKYICVNGQNLNMWSVTYDKCWGILKSERFTCLMDASDMKQFGKHLKEWKKRRKVLKENGIVISQSAIFPHRMGWSSGKVTVKDYTTS